MTDQPKPKPIEIPKKKKGGWLRNLANAVVRVVLSPLGAFGEDE